MFLGCLAGQGMKPVGVMGGIVLNGPFLQGMSYTLRHLTGHRFSPCNRFTEPVEHVEGELLPHDAFIEGQLAENVRYLHRTTPVSWTVVAGTGSAFLPQPAARSNTTVIRMIIIFRTGASMSGFARIIQERTSVSRIKPDIFQNSFSVKKKGLLRKGTGPVQSGMGRGKISLRL